MRGPWVMCAALAVACGSAAAPKKQPVEPQVVKPAAPKPEQTTAGHPTPPEPPKGYVEMVAAGVASAGDDAQAVGLVEPQKKLVLPIFIGGTEAMTIALRLYKQPFSRPLTHDLMDSMLRKLDAEIYKVQVDDLVDGVFIGSVFINRGAQIWELDARPSDAIAIAIGHKAPIYVSQKVLSAAAQSGLTGGESEDPGEPSEKVTPKPQ